MPAPDEDDPGRGPDERARARDLRPGGVAPTPPSRLTRPTPATKDAPPTIDTPPPQDTPGDAVTPARPTPPPRTPAPRTAPARTPPEAARPRTPDPGPPRPRWFRRRTTLAAGGVLLVLVAGLVWVVVTGLLARSHLEQARSEVARLQTSLTRGGAGPADPADIDARIQRIAADAHRAHQLTTGPAWAVSAAVPWAGRPAVVTRGLTKTADGLTRAALPALGRVADRVAGGGVRQGGNIDLSALATLAPDLDVASQGFDAARGDLADLPTGSWLGPVDRARSAVSDQVGQLAGTLGSADAAVQVLPAMLGSTTPQRYFVAFQNNAEARGTGGLPGAFGIVTAVDGRVSFERFESDDLFLKPRLDVAGAVDFGAEQADYLAQYGLALPFGDYRDSNESPHFPYAAQIWAAMWHRYSGETITGAVAVDPTALSYLLEATGAVTLADGSTLSAADIVAVTQRDVYARFPGVDAAQIDRRKTFLLDVAARTEQALLGPGADTAVLVRGAGRAATERRLLVWSADPAVEAVLSRSAIGGALPETRQPFGLLTVLNIAGTKLDYYLDRRVTWTRSGCGDTRDVTVQITMTNRAPASGLPAYVTYRADDPEAGTPVGSNRWALDWFATSGALLKGVTIDGRQGAARTYQQRGHPVFETLVEVPPGGSHTIVLQLREPAGTEPVTLLTQPLVRPLTQTAHDTGC